MNTRTVAFLVFGLPGIITCAQAQNLYDINTVQEIRINFYQTNWDYTLDSLKDVDEEAYLLVPSIEINGVVFDSVGVKYKGNSSYDEDFLKNPLNIELDYIRKNQNYQGINDIKLSNGYSDPTMVREVLGYDILRQYMAAPLANHAKVWMNGEYWGVYVNVESINKRFVRNHFHTDGNNPFFKCNPADFPGPGSGGNFPDLVYTSADSAFYYDKYELRSNSGWHELLALMDTLANHPGSIHEILDVDRALWMLAFNNVTVNLDSYTGAYAQNYYLYWDKNDRWLPVMWDLNMGFGAFPLIDGGPIPTIAQLKVLSPLLQSDNFYRPLIKQLLANPQYKRMYLAHMRTMLQENFSGQVFKDRALALQANIDAAIQTDTKKFYSYANFQNNINATVSAPGGFGDVPGLTDLMNTRYNFLINESNFTPAPPVISNVAAQTTSVVWVTAQVQNAATVLLGWRYDSSDVFVRTPMFDDGMHQDGAAGDGQFGASFPVGDIKGQYYIYAENSGAGAFSPQRAEYEFYQTPTLPPLPNAGDLVLNEFLANNKTSEKDEAGQYEDWLELYNNSNQPISLLGLYLSDTPLKPNKWSFPSNSTIPAKGFLIVWLDEDQSQGPFHANFRLNTNGEFLMLSNGAGGVVDSLSYGPQKADTTFGRYPNGTGSFTFMPRTFNAPNSLTTGTAEPGKGGQVLVYPNPADQFLNVRADQPLGAIEVSDGMGRKVLLLDAGLQTSASFHLGHLPSGMYSLRTAQGATVLFNIQR